LEEDDKQQVELAVARPNWERVGVWAGFDISPLLSPLLVGFWVRGWMGSASVVFLNFGLERLPFFLSLSLRLPLGVLLFPGLPWGSILVFYQLACCECGIRFLEFWGLAVRVCADVTHLRNAGSSDRQSTLCQCLS